jgi:hypothetical protein
VTARATKLTVLALILFSLCGTAFAEVIVFENYQTTLEYKDNKLIVHKSMRLKNVGGNPIIPGEIHFKLSEDSKKGSVAPKVTSFVVKDHFNNDLETRKVDSTNQVDLVFTLWDPLLPGFYHDLTMDYEMEFKPKGVLFYEISIPTEKTTIPIQNVKTEFLLPKNLHITYAPGMEVASDADNRIVRFSDNNNLVFEYSIIPFPRTGLKAVNIFWSVLILLFLVNLIARIRNKRRTAVVEDVRF